MRPTIIPDNTTTGITVSGTFDTGNWYSCGAPLLTMLRSYSKDHTHKRSSRHYIVSFLVPAPIKRYGDFDTHTRGRCYHTLRLFVTRRWRHPQEGSDRDVPLAFSGIEGDATIVITSPGLDKMNEPQEGRYENNAPFFEGSSRTTVGETLEGFPIEKRGDYPGRHTVL